MNPENNEFDLLQGHGDHHESVLDGLTFADLEAALPDLFAEAEVIAVTDEAIPCNPDEGVSASMRFILLRDSMEQLHFTFLVGFEEGANESQLYAFYPECDGSLVPVTVTAVYEWANGVEATIVGTFGDGNHPIAFFDTRYAINKGKYVLGEKYDFRLAALAFNANIVQDPVFKFEGEEAEQQRERFGDEQIYDEDGNPEPMVFDASSLVALMQTSTAYPHVATIFSPAFKVDFKQFVSGNFVVLTIAISRTLEDDTIDIPLIAKLSFFPEGVLEGDPIQGAVWLQGYREEKE